MARIETYPLDYNISVNDYVIGTDGDSLNATKNYKVLTFLDYLGTMYNLNSTDLLFNYNNVAAGSVANGQVSTNNFADPTILMSGVTNIYVSKVTAFGQLVDDIINTTGTEGLSIMFTDMGNRNNLGIFTVVSTTDVDANTINMTVTASTAVGSISAGKVMGIRIGVGGGGVTDGDKGDITVSSEGTVWEVNDGYVDLVNSQTIGGNKAFSNFIIARGGYESNATNAALNVFSMFRNSQVPSGTDNGGAAGQLLLNNNNNWTFLSTSTGGKGWTINNDNNTALRTYQVQNKDGTLAHLDDIPTLTDPYRGRIDSSGAATAASFNVLTYGNIELTTTQTTCDVSFTNESSVTGYPIVIRLYSSNASGTTFSFTSGIYDKNGNNTFDVFVPNGEHKVIHFVVAESSATVATNYPDVEEVDDTWTPVWSDSGGGATYSQVGQAHYYKQGSQVTCLVDVDTWIKTGAHTGLMALDVDSLPFAPKALSGEFPFNISINRMQNIGTTFYHITMNYANLAGSLSGLCFYYKNSLTDDLNTLLPSINSGASFSLVFSYLTDE